MAEVSVWVTGRNQPKSDLQTLLGMLHRVPSKPSFAADAKASLLPTACERAKQERRQAQHSSHDFNTIMEDIVLHFREQHIADSVRASQ